VYGPEEDALDFSVAKNQESRRAFKCSREFVENAAQRFRNSAIDV
jgi:hypothetical protein